MFNKPITEFNDKYFFLSNFFEYVIVFEGNVYKSTEHAYQAQKALDIGEFEIIRATKTPGEAKKLGRGVFMRKDWDDIKVGVMRDILWAKFSNPDLGKKLLSTGTAQLIEGNNWKDYFWGVCDGKGENMLGKLLMEIREELKNPENVILP